MKIKTLSLLSALSLLLTIAVTLPPPARMQGRGVSVGAPAAAASASSYHALVIGNNAYTGLRKLKTAQADAREVAALLKEFYGFETRLLLDATRTQIVSALSAYRRELGGEANLLIYYAGHGIYDKEADKAYWLPVDAVRDDDANWISADDITTRIRAIPARHVLVVSDSCYSGTLTRGLGEALPRPNEREQFLRRMAAGRSRTLMASGGNEPVTDGGGDGRHSVFANALLRGLQVMDKGQFTGTELFTSYIVEPVAGRAEQTPEYNPLKNSGHESGDFIFVRIKTTGQNVEVTVKTPAPPKIDPSVFELEYWNAIKDSSDPEEYREYLEKYPQGQFAAIAKRRAAGGRGGNNTASRPPATAATDNATPPASVPKPAGGNAARPRAATNRYGIELVYVPAGSFMMGAENGVADEKPVHRVTISEGFYIGMYEVTQAQWQAVVGSNPSYFKGENRPVEQVSWDDVQTFLQKLNAQNDGYVYRLPSEAEWEYAARAGTTADYAGNLDQIAWYGNNSGNNPLDAVAIYAKDSANYYKRIMENGGQTHPVGQKQPNAFGLYDMHGNVWEWCQDYYQESYAGAPSDGSAWLRGKESKYRVLRGGSWVGGAGYLRSAVRGRSEPGNRLYIFGFRVVADART